MKIINKANKTVDIQLSIDELNTMKNSLVESSKGISKYEFSTRLGVSLEKAITLAEEIHKIVEKAKSKPIIED